MKRVGKELQNWFFRYGMTKEQCSLFNQYRFNLDAKTREVWEGLISIVGRAYKRGYKDGKLAKK